MPEVSKPPKSNAEKLTTYRAGLATTLKRLEDKVDTLADAVLALAESRCEQCRPEVRQ